MPGAPCAAQPSGNAGRAGCPANALAWGFRFTTLTLNHHLRRVNYYPGISLPLLSVWKQAATTTKQLLAHAKPIGSIGTPGALTRLIACNLSRPSQTSRRQLDYSPAIRWPGQHDGGTRRVGCPACRLPDGHSRTLGCRPRRRAGASRTPAPTYRTGVPRG